MSDPISTLTEAQDWVRALLETRERTIEQLRSGELAIADVFDVAQTNDLVARIAVLKLYEAVPGNGKVRSRRAMAQAHIADNTPTGDLDPAQQARMAELLAESAV